MGKKPIVSVTYENERISIKNIVYTIKICSMYKLYNKKIGI